MRNEEKFTKVESSEKDKKGSIKKLKREVRIKTTNLTKGIKSDKAQEKGT
jgi:hypothetical protein